MTEPRDTGDAAGQRQLTEAEKVVRAFLRDGRLVSIPAKPKKRDLLLPVLWILGWTGSGVTWRGHHISTVESESAV